MRLQISSGLWSDVICLAESRDNVALPYLDDIILFSRIFGKHIEHLRAMLRKLRKHRVTLKPRKCSLFKRQAMVSGWTQGVYMQLRSK